MLIEGVDKIRVMLIDDVSFTRLTLRHMMEQIGFQDIIEAEDGAAARNVMVNMSPPPGLLIVDYHMPGLDGLELLRAVRSGQASPIAHDIPFIMVTGEGKLENFISAIQLDVDAFLDKPTTRTQIEEKISRLIGDKKTERAIKDPVYYQDIDVESARDIFGEVVLAEPEKNSSEQEISLDIAVPGAILSRDLQHGKGHQMLPANTVLNEELLILLQKINMLTGGINSIWVRS